MYTMSPEEHALRLSLYDGYKTAAMDQLIKCHDKLCGESGFGLYIRMRPRDSESFSLVSAREHCSRRSRIGGLAVSIIGIFMSIERLPDVLNSECAGHIFIPVVVDFGIDKNIVHQCALLACPADREFIFYEPYGIYTKYGRDYTDTMRGYKPAWSFDTFHHKFGRPKGIQTYLLEFGAASPTYNADLRRVLDGLAAVPELAAAVRDEIADDADPVVATDRTYGTLHIAVAVYAAAAVATTAGSTELVDSALELYGKYSAKICVPITLAEMAAFAEDRLDEFYAEVFAAEWPARAVMAKACPHAIVET